LTLIKIHLARLLFFPSFLCLDAPLAALGWALCLSADLGRPDQGTFPAAAALFLCVWLIYLFDRLYDVSRRDGAKQFTPRHEWARQHRFLLGSWFVAAFVLFSVVVLPRLETKTILTGFALGLVTGLYYLAFRFSRFYSCLRGVVPFKELTIALCFTGGIFLVAWPTVLTMALVLLAAGCLSLFTANCLVISRAEQGSDHLADPAAYFSRPIRTSRLPEWSALFAAGCGVVACLVARGADRSPVSLLLCGFFTFLVARRRADEEGLTQPLADGIQMIPWVVFALSRTWTAAG
jgi:hypothetical protein